MIYIIIIIAWFCNAEFERGDINQTWILNEKSRKVWIWSARTENNDILKFTDDSTLEIIDIEKGLIRKVKYEINKNKEIVLEKGYVLGKIKSLNKKRLIIDYDYGKQKHNETYLLLPETELEIAEPEIISQIKNHNWITNVESEYEASKVLLSNFGEKETLSLRKNKDEKDKDFNIQLGIKSSRREKLMPAKIIKIENSFFLSYQFEIKPSSEKGNKHGQESFLITKITEDEIQIAFDSDREEILTFRRKTQ